MADKLPLVVDPVLKQLREMQAGETIPAEVLTKALEVVLTGLSASNTAGITGADTILQAMGKLQGQLNGAGTAIAGKVDKIAGHSLISDAERVTLANAAQRSELGSAAAATLVTSVGDQTAGRAMVLGGLGYGGDIPTYTVNIDDKAQRGWSYASVPAGTTGTFPIGYDYGLLHTFGADQGADQTFQELYALAGHNAAMPKFIRSTYGGATEWTDWRMILDTHSVIGSLALGAWCQIDRTAAGDVYRYADGRMRIDTPWVIGIAAGYTPVALPANFFGRASPTYAVGASPSYASAYEGEAGINNTEANPVVWWRLSIEGRWKA